MELSEELRAETRHPEKEWEEGLSGLTSYEPD
jgi:hypothetical protein